MDEDIQVFIHSWLKDSQNDKFIKTSTPHPDIIEAVYSLIENWKNHKELVDTLCIRLFGFYREEELESKAFTLQYIPSLVFTYLNGIAAGEKKDVRSIQTLLLAIYNMEAGEEAQNPKTHSFRVPNIAQPSIYHEPLGLASSSLTETALRRLDPANRITVKFGPHLHLHSFNAENRLPALSALLRIYSHNLSLYSKISLNESCLAFNRLVAQGFTRQPEPSVRIPVSSQLLIEVLQIIYSLTSLPISTGTLIRLHSPVTPAPSTSIEDGELASRARQTLEAVKQRVEMELIAAPLLVSAAVVDSSQLSIKGVNSSPQLVSSSASGTARAMWKSMITNASFRTKKLPDDITVALATDLDGSTSSLAASSGSVPPQSLGSISEENDEPSTGGGNKSFRLPEQLSSLVKKKSKPKSVKRPVIVESNSTTSHANDNGSSLNNDWNTTTSGDGAADDVIEMRPHRIPECNITTQV